MGRLLQIKDLTKDYGNGRGIFHVYMECVSGEITVLVGENGSGKTTLMKCILNHLKHYDGKIYIDGSINSTERFYEQFGYVPECVELPKEIKVGVYLSAVASMRNIDMNNINQRIDEELSYWNLNQYKNCKIGNLSKGNRQKIAIIQSYIHNPNIILLDEPTTGLDFIARDLFIKKIKELRTKEKIIILSTHILEDVQQLSTNVHIFYQGSLYRTLVGDEILETRDIVIQLYQQDGGK